MTILEETIRDQTKPDQIKPDRIKQDQTNQDQPNQDKSIQVSTNKPEQSFQLVFYSLIKLNKKETIMFNHEVSQSFTDSIQTPFSRLFAIIFCLGVSQQVLAQEQTGPYVGIGINQTFFSNSNQLDDESAPSLLLGYQVSERWGIEIESAQFDTVVSFNPTQKFTTKLNAISGKYREKGLHQDSMFWKVGVGEYSQLPVSGDTQVARVGLGYEWANNKPLALSLGAEGIYTFDQQNWDTNLYVNAIYYFSSRAQSTAKKPEPTPPQPAPQPVPQDSDKDGVIDSADQCPNSKANVTVDSRGCELDTDGDGVVDSLDECPQTPQGAKVTSNGCREMLAQDVSITLNVNFANNSSVVNDSYRSEIQKVADFMRLYPDTTAVIEGHTDDRGAAAYNQKLSLERAEAVMRYLVEQLGIQASRLSAVGIGEASPIASNDTAEGRATNRRVQASIKTTVITEQ